MRSLPNGLSGHIDLYRRPNIEGDYNRGWQADLLEAKVDGYCAGYLLITYIPTDRLQQHYPLKGWDVLRKLDGINAKDQPEPSYELAGLLKRGYGVELKQFSPEISVEEFSSLIQKGTEKIWQKHLDWFWNRPKPDFIRVYNEWDEYEHTWDCTQPYGAPGRRKREANIDFRGLGIGHLLYREGARWMAEKGLFLHSSRLQQPEAIQAWKKLQEQVPYAIKPETRKSVVSGMEQADPACLVLDGLALENWIPHWASSMNITEYTSNPEERMALPSPF